MLFYEELGRHTPPPPPYSLSKRRTTKVKLENEASQPPPPPPPPPYLSSTPKPDCTIPSIDELWRQAVVSDGPYLARQGNAIPFPLVPLQRSATQVFDSEQCFGDSQGGLNCNWSCPGIPAHPVEPRWTPVGILGYPGPPLEGAMAPLPEYPLESGGHSVPRSFVFSPRTGIGLDHQKWTSQSPSTVSLGHNVVCHATQPPVHTLATRSMMDQKPLYTFRKQSSRDIASLANITTTDVTGSFGPSETMYSLSALPSQQAVEKRAKLTPRPTPQEFDAVRKVSDVKSPPDANQRSSSDGDASEGDGDSARVPKVAKGQDNAFPTRFKPDPRPSKDRTTSQRPDRVHHVSHSSHRRPSASARFEPYKRRQSKVAEMMKQRQGGAAEKGYAQSLQMQSDLDMNEGEGEETE
ncbi:hypothetical protein HO133_006775 [Letharia lupina]|uniref:Uncharacterized protein n=1 Tax=Letharia lupina TaxID=560253 RepID=A0A8H6C6H5_9LECA|nr:uncharacterized protein HO133_006775 [Letharia lupina]KAF6217673.1 hypothetical protein HO133_006775 [Letharia lupina]